MPHGPPYNGNEGVKEKWTKSHYPETTAHHGRTHDHKGISPDNRIAIVIYHHVPVVVDVDIDVISAPVDCIITSPVTYVRIVSDPVVIAYVCIVAAPVTYVGIVAA